MTRTYFVDVVFVFEERKRRVEKRVSLKVRLYESGRKLLQKLQNIAYTNMVLTITVKETK